MKKQNIQLFIILFSIVSGIGFQKLFSQTSYNNLRDFHTDKFYFVEALVDTVYYVENKMAEEKFGESGQKTTFYETFYNKTDLDEFLHQQLAQTGESFSEYEVRITETEACYFSKNSVSIADYKDFCQATGKPLPDFHKTTDLSEPVTYTEASYGDMEEYCKYLSNLWNVPVRIGMGYHNDYQIVINKSDWDRKVFKTDVDQKEFPDKLNSYMQQAYGKTPPVVFTSEGVKTDGQLIVWDDVRDMRVDRNKQEAMIKGTAEAIIFSFTEEQYTHIAPLHVNFLAFYQKMLSDY